MKKMIFALMMMLTATVSANAMSYEQARNEALFLTDKMAYELNLTDEQYEAAYEINLDYLMGVTSRYDVYGTYWERRNLDLSYILLDWQWNAFIAASYFYRPLYWDAGYWHFGIYARYPHRDYFYFGRPHFYHSYHGAHAWHRVGGHGYYHGHAASEEALSKGEILVTTGASSAEVAPWSAGTVLPEVWNVGVPPDLSTEVLVATAPSAAPAVAA